MVYADQDIQEFDKQIKQLLDKGLIRNDKSHHTNPAFTVRNHAEEKRGKTRMVINYKKLNNNTVFDSYYIPQTSLFQKNSRSFLVLENGLQKRILTDKNG